MVVVSTRGVVGGTKEEEGRLEITIQGSGPKKR